jgi:glycosyltransferase involved in cell wall biosynthesis
MRRLRVGVDARTVYSPVRRGTGKNLIDLYSTIADAHADVEMVMFHQHEVDPADDPFAGRPNVRARRIDIRGDRWNLWQDVRLPLAASTERVDVLHCPSNTAPLQTFTPVVVTIHDLIPLEIAPEAPETTRWARRVRRSAQKAARIITPSHYSRKAIAERLGAPAAKITVNYWAPDKRCTRVTDTRAIAGVRHKYDVADAPYVLAFGAADPRKNTGAILTAWQTLSDKDRAGARLLVVGLQPAALESFRAALAARRDTGCVLHGFAAESDLPALLSGATALCYPSKSEGFGLPILDAFACGTPVITSSVTSLPEVADDAAILVDPDDTQSIGRAIRELLGSEDLRVRLRDAGFRRAAAFSWERCAATAADVLFAAARGGNGTIN